MPDKRSEAIGSKKQKSFARQRQNRTIRKHRCRVKPNDTAEIFDGFSNLQVGTECDTLFHGAQVTFQDKRSENFTYIVDLDSYEFHKIIVHDFLGRILHSVVFRTFILLLVLLNALLIGLQTIEWFEENYGILFSIIDHIVLSIFIFEILIKWAHDFTLFWTVMWNVMDFIIVVLVVASAVTANIENSRVLVLVRVVRAFRSLRSVSSLSSLAIVTHTIVKSIGDMMSILFVLMIFMIVLAVMGVTLFELEEINEFTDTFNSPFNTWYLLFVCITQDGWVDYMERWRGKPYFWLLMIYIVVAIAIGAFIFSNLIIAVVVANLEMGVAEIRAMRIAAQNPLINYGESSSKVDINPVRGIFEEDNMPLRAQRPMKVPQLKHVSERQLQAYFQLIVALEQNMLENANIIKDLERIMAAILSIGKQLEKFDTNTTAETKAKVDKLVTELKSVSKLKLPTNPFDAAALLQAIRKREP